MTDRGRETVEKLKESEFAQGARRDVNIALERTSSGMSALTAKAAEVSDAAVAWGGTVQASQILGGVSTVSFTQEGPLGISFGSIGESTDHPDTPKVVIGVDEDGMAAQVGGVRMNMVLIAVQDVPCEALSFNATLDLIRDGSRPLSLTFRLPSRWGTGGKMNWVNDTDWDAALDVTTSEHAASLSQETEAGVTAAPAEPVPLPEGPPLVAPGEPCNP